MDTGWRGIDIVVLAILTILTHGATQIGRYMRKCGSC
jgi:hypothetical protein